MVFPLLRGVQYLLCGYQNWFADDEQIYKRQESLELYDPVRGKKRLFELLG
jgi:hypothetical protein